MSDVPPPGPLERQYRRLLAAYPAEHRREHGEEMIGVLLAAARPGQVRAGLAGTADLIRGGLRIRLRPRAALRDADGWRADLATASVALPVLLLAAVSWSYLADAAAGDYPFGLKGSLFGLVFLGQLLIVPLVLAGFRRVAAAVAVVQAAAGALRVLTGAGLTSSFRGGTLIAEGVTLAALSLIEAAALLASPGARTGRPVPGRRRWAVVLLASVPAAALSPTFLPLGPRLGPGAGSLVPVRVWIWTAACAALAVLLLGLWLSSAAGKRLALLFTVAGYPYLLFSLVVTARPFWPPQTGILISTPMLLAAAALAFVIARSGPVHGGPANRRDAAPGRRRTGLAQRDLEPDGSSAVAGVTHAPGAGQHGDDG